MMAKGVWAALVLAAASPATAAEPKVIDLTGEFASLWEKSAALPEPEKVAAFKAHFEPLIPGFFRSRYFDPLIAKSLSTFAEDRAGIEQVRLLFTPALAPAAKSFAQAFGSSPVEHEIYLIHSTGELDGSVRRIGGKDHLVFGADRLAKRLGPDGRANIRPLIHHEMFHLHHAKSFTGCWDRLWCDIWREGLAVFAAEALNPDASADDLTIANLRAALDARPNPAICLVRARLDSSDPEERRNFGSMNFTVPGMPPRFGYYVGYLAAKEMSRTHNLAELAAMRVEQVRPALEQSLERLASCPAKTAD